MAGMATEAVLPSARKVLVVVYVPTRPPSAGGMTID